MDKWEVRKRILDSGVVAVIREANSETIIDLAKALVKGGIDCLELTVENPESFAAMTLLKQMMGNQVVVGAGTVLDAETAKRSIDAGASFIVSPIVKKEIIEMTNRYGKLSVPGLLTPTEMVAAYESGADMVKLFPARTFGPDYIKDVKGPLSHIPIMPTGGINKQNAGDFIKNGAAAVGAGGSLVDLRLSYEEITEKALQLTEAVKQAKRELVAK
ncbi:2-dehydro-3-deoxyphosphogluconate aldolase/(4S)-4-hydroxy-2-oxoglutarate aldolase [Bacillus fengqiuensis]|nr:2-dehydro-3-deoxyphosphogluconate aldolase/(4S)-4-hydroxy-2-oxoglutarate aldolase [Bacillus fengqiuensis]